MSKRVIAFILAVAMMATLFVALPASATNFKDNIIFDAEYNKESYYDQTGWVPDENVFISHLDEGSWAFEDDAELGKKVLHTQSKVFQYIPTDYEPLRDNFTMETYVYVNRNAGNGYSDRYALVFGDFWESVENKTATGAGFAMHTMRDGYGAIGLSLIEGKGQTRDEDNVKIPAMQTIAEPNAANAKRMYGRWIHLVYTHENSRATYYVDGELVGQETTIDEVPIDYLVVQQGLRLGGYNMADNWSVFDMKASYARIYRQAATAEDVAQLYADRNVDFDAPAYQPTPAPTERPVYFDMGDEILFEVDFRNMEENIPLASMEESTGAYTINVGSSGAYTAVEYNDELDANVGFFDGLEAGLVYTGPTLARYDLTKGLTVEAYVWLDPDWSIDHNNCIIEAAYNGINLEDYCTDEDQLSGFRCAQQYGPNGEVLGGGDAYMCNAYENVSLPRGEWLHLVGVTDGSTNKYYLNGELRVTVDRYSAVLPDTGAGMKNVIVGGSNGGHNFDGLIAYARIYHADASEFQVRELYAEATGTEMPVPTEEPTAEPSFVPGTIEWSADPVEPFHSGDTVEAKFTLSGEDSEYGIMGLDLELSYDHSKFEIVGPVSSWENSLAALNAETGLNWTLNGNANADPVTVKIIEDSNPPLGMVADATGKIWFIAKFTALVDSTDGMEVATLSVDPVSVDSEFNEISGTGATAAVSGTLAPSVVYGDVNGDGDIKANDYMVLRNYLAGKTVNGTFIPANADVNGNGSIQANDYMILRNYLAGKPNVVLGPQN